MSTRKIGYALIVIGTAAALISLLADWLSAGPRGIQAAQLLAIELGVIAALGGAWFAFMKPNQPLKGIKQLRRLRQKFSDLPNIAWVLLGFGIVYVLFFISPIFLNSTLRMQYFYRYLPDRSPIGNDLLVPLDLIRAWFNTGQSPYTDQFYPPLVYVLFAPLLLLDYPVAYTLVTILTLLGFAFSLWIARLINPERSVPLILLLLVTGLLSYGLQFELERGQFNVIAFMLCLLSVYLFHEHHEVRYLAYLLFSFSVQLKIYPAIFILMLVKDWRDWKGNLKRIGGLAALNIALLFVAGYRMFADFNTAVTRQLISPTMNYWNGNHSIKAFVFGLTGHGYGLIAKPARLLLRPHSGLIETALLVLFALCLLLAILRAYRLNQTGLNSWLLLVCTIGALIIPISNDYKLSILAAPAAMALCALPEIRDSPRKLLLPGLLVIASTAYASLLIPFKYKPYLLSNNFPALLVILVSITALNLIQSPQE